MQKYKLKTRKKPFTSYILHKKSKIKLKPLRLHFVFVIKNN